jgi:hypothetical protein
VQALLIVSAIVVGAPLKEAEREPLALLVSIPTRENAAIPRAEIIRIADRIVRASTHLGIVEIEETIMRQCKGALSCIVRRGRQDYDRDALLDVEGRPIPYAEHVRDLQERRTPYPKFLLVVSTVTSSDFGDRYFISFVDTDVALEAYHAAPRHRTGWQDEVEVAIDEHAVRARRNDVVLANGQALEEVLRALFLVEAKPALEAAGVFGAYGAIEIDAKIGGLTIRLDGNAIGPSEPTRTRVEDVRAGRRKIALESGGLVRFEREVEIEPGRTAYVGEIALPAMANPIRTGVVWAGVGTAAIGGAITIWAIARSAGGMHTACWSCTSGPAFDTFGGGILSGPLGYSLILAGATWAMATILWSDPGDIPWPEIAAGLVLGGAAYGISAIANKAAPN